MPLRPSLTFVWISSAAGAHRFGLHNNVPSESLIFILEMVITKCQLLSFSCTWNKIFLKKSEKSSYRTQRHPRWEGSGTVRRTFSSLSRFRVSTFQRGRAVFPLKNAPQTHSDVICAAGSPLWELGFPWLSPQILECHSAPTSSWKSVIWECAMVEKNVSTFKSPPREQEKGSALSTKPVTLGIGNH